MLFIKLVVLVDVVYLVSFCLGFYLWCFCCWCCYCCCLLLGSSTFDLIENFVLVIVYLFSFCLYWWRTLLLLLLLLFVVGLFYLWSNWTCQKCLEKTNQKNFYFFQLCSAVLSNKNTRFDESNRKRSGNSGNTETSGKTENPVNFIEGCVPYQLVFEPKRDRIGEQIQVKKNSILLFVSLGV
jgi:hypothetical protein